MPPAAAALVGAARGYGRHNGGRSLSHSAGSAMDGAKIATGVSTCACAALSSIGLSLLVKSLTNARGERVSDFDEHTVNWEQTARGDFAALEINITISGTTGLGRNRSQSMKPSAAAEPVFPDAEHGKGLISYHPLKYLASFELESYYPSDTDAWKLLPNRSGARHVTFEFTTRSKGGQWSVFTTPPFPLAWDEVVHARTPAPHDKCRREQHGIWWHRQCHVVKRLESVCLQVHLDADGVWRPFRKGTPPVAASPGVPPAETYGCSPKNLWNPASYSIDPCWGQSQSKHCPDAGTPVHPLQVKLRCAADPILRAEELTDNTLDFGLSPASQRASGATLLMIGLCLGIVPCARAWLFCRRSLRSTGQGGRALRDSRADFPELRGSATGIYGNSMM